MDCLELLAADHDRVRGLFARFASAASAADAELMASLVVSIVDELEVHTTIEEEIFYPAATGCSDELTALIDEGWQEHHVAKTLIAELALEPTGSPTWVAKVKVLIEAVSHHADEEESDMWPMVRSAMDAERRNDLGDELTARKRLMGAPTIHDAIDLTTTELREMASVQEIPGRSSMDHDRLAATVDPR